ncbi:hypothetical protein RI367_005958 [Sorochytrium milnesiophthora]
MDIDRLLQSVDGFNAKSVDYLIQQRFTSFNPTGHWLVRFNELISPVMSRLLHNSIMTGQRIEALELSEVQGQAHETDWIDPIMHGCYDGNAVLVSNLPRHTTQDDIYLMFRRYNIVRRNAGLSDPILLLKSTSGYPLSKALVKFQTNIDGWNAVRDMTGKKLWPRYASVAGIQAQPLFCTVVYNVVPGACLPTSSKQQQKRRQIDRVEE